MIIITFSPQKMTKLFRHWFQYCMKKLMNVGQVLPNPIVTLWNSCRWARRWVGGAKAIQASVNAESSVCQWC